METKKDTLKDARFFKFAIDNNSIPTYWVSSDACIVYASKAACRELKYTFDELTSMKVPEIDPDFPFDAWDTHWQKMKEDHVFPIEIQSTFIELDGHEYICANVKNVTDHKNAEMQISKLSMAIEQSPASVIITDNNGDIEYVNPQFTKTTGYSKDEVMGKIPVY